MVVLKYLKGWFKRTTFSVRCQDFLAELKVFKPLLHKQQRRRIRPVFKSIVRKHHEERKLRTIWLARFIGAIVLLCAIVDWQQFHPWFLLFSFVCLVATPAVTYWSLREYYHEADVAVRKAIAKRRAAKKKEADAKKSAAKPTSSPKLSQSGLTPRPRSLHP